MNKMMLFMVVTGAWFLVTGILGFILQRKGRPYKLVILIIHGFLSVFILAGILSCIFQLQLITNGKLFLSIFIYLFAIAAIGKIISGIFMAVIKKDSPKVELFHKAKLFHKINTYLIIISLIVNIIFLAVKM